MTRLWAPWRLPYIRRAEKGGPEGDGCFFCADARTPRRDRRNLVLRRGKTCFVLLNRFPYTGGHLLVAPYAHKADLAALDSAERLELLDHAADMQALLGRHMKPHGFNLGINLGRPAGAGVPGHLHLHVVPRWSGDVNFMTSVAGVRVVPQALDELYGELKNALSRAT